ncbi:hypothetical protein THAOC_22572 [Thalassiosira oceanica]|uniref:Uncharacterized protein n=1 Tax=Thalassiosira oceanica TaxID=159749 RepID=K0S8Z2_THAOC|nr:hypothetical protein THAOC_22572 [Thalassiosira oceanica]|eukprot:EJK57391.1 hypothetical protein THAOC_22572 [Thalassiosira oceanica]
MSNAPSIAAAWLATPPKSRIDVCWTDLSSYCLGNVDSKLYLCLTSVELFGALAVAWIVEACLVSFNGPFVYTGNGYFASWAGAATSSMAACAAMQDS